MSTSIEQLVARRQEIKMELNMIEHELTRAVENFDGSVIDALDMGLVRLNFPAPPGFYQHVKEGRGSKANR